MCPTCGSPERRLWTFGKLPKLDELHVGNWISLRRCPACEALWASVPHEPYASFEFLTSWPYTEEQWHAVHALEDSRVIHEWHNAVIREHWAELPEREQQFVEQWRDRTYQHYNPIDQGPDTQPPRFILKEADIESVIAGLS